MGKNLQKNRFLYLLTGLAGLILGLLIAQILPHRSTLASEIEGTTYKSGPFFISPKDGKLITVEKIINSALEKKKKIAHLLERVLATEKGSSERAALVNKEKKRKG